MEILEEQKTTTTTENTNEKVAFVFEKNQQEAGMLLTGALLASLVTDNMMGCYTEYVGKVLTLIGKSELGNNWNSTTEGWTTGILPVMKAKDKAAMSVIIALAKSGYNLDEYNAISGITFKDKQAKDKALRNFIEKTGPCLTGEEFSVAIAEAANLIEAGSAAVSIQTVEAEKVSETFEETIARADKNFESFAASIGATVASATVESSTGTGGANDDSSSWGDVALGLGAIVAVGLVAYWGYSTFCDGCGSDYDTIIVD